MPRATRRSARSPVMSAPSNQIDPERGRRQSAHRAQERRLARAVRADQRRDLARAHLEVDAAQRGDRAVGDTESDSTRKSGAEPSLTRSLPLASVAEIGLDHARVAAHLLGRAFGDLLAVVEHRYRARTGSSRTGCRGRSARC
jgi:hypothetical protein